MITNRGFIGITLIVIAIVGLLVLALIGGVQRQKWLDEHCEKMGKISGSTSIGISTGKDGGVVPIFTPGKTGYKCDDGIEYWE